ncbi:MAG: glycosyltransferase family 2 protein [Phycisphaerae bacterium]|nr:glycosyltransferase family 2 protein [Phycisphaerae bacterium]
MLEYTLWTLAALYALIAGAWAWGVIRLRTFKFDEDLRLTPLPVWPADRSAPSIDVVIAAHNEEDTIGPCLTALLQQGYPNLRILVANDRSDDRTAEVIDGIAARHAEVRQVCVLDLPDGWIGKTHALSVAATECTADYILFIDSDVRLVPGAINAVMKKTLDDRLDFLSLWPSLELESFAERLLTPPAGWLLSFWALLSTGAGARPTDVKLGNGQFMMLRRECYEKVGGHVAVKAELAEDAIIANTVAAMGFRRWAGLGRGVYITARTGSLQRTMNAITRVVIGSLCTQWRVLASTQILLGGCVIPIWLFPLSLALWIAFRHPAAITFATIAAVHYVAMTIVLRHLFELTLVKRGSLLWFPIGCVLVSGILVWSWLVMTGHGAVRWGKTRYAVRGSRILHTIGDAPTRVAAAS